MNNYIPASPTSYIGHLKTSDVTIEEISKFFGKYTAGVLHCIDADISSKKNIHKLNINCNKTIDKLQPLLTNTPLYLDSGGFQVLTGKYDIEAVKELFVEYYCFLETSERYNKSFVLDLPPNEICFNNWDDVRYWNNKSYKRAAEMNSQKNIFVFHMLNYESYKIWDELFEKYHTQFGMFAVGGIAIKQYGKMNRIISFSIPFKVYLEKCIRHNIKDITIHFLGSGHFSSTLTFLFEFTKYFIKQKYDINMHIQSDSCAHIGLSLGRQMAVINNDIVYRIKYFSKELDFHFCDKTKENYIIDTINKFAEEEGFKGRVNNIYLEDGHTNPTFYILLTLYDILIYKKIQSIIRNEIPTLYRLYLEDQESFYDNLMDLQKRLNGNRITRVLKKDTVNIFKFLEIIQGKDLNRIIQLLKNNSTELFSKNKLLTI